jgi:N-acetylglucosamine-6-phosphate deacetylase
MSALTSREPGLAGAVLSGDIGAGIIADGHHVHPATLHAALRARPAGLFLVSDCMAFAGSDLTEITLGGRKIMRKDGILTLADGTLAGADLRLDDALRLIIESVGLPPEQALAMATSTPAALIGRASEFGHIAPQRAADLVHLDGHWRLRNIWHKGAELTP